MSKDLRSENITFLSNRFPQLAERIENHRIPPGRYHPTIHSCEKSAFTASVSIDGREVYLHSRYDPVREAQRWAASQTPPSGSVVLIVGWGMGYHALEWIKSFGRIVEAVIVFEPEPELFKTSLFCIDLRPLALARRLELIVGCDVPVFDEAIQNLIEPLLSRDLSLLPLPFVDIYPAEVTVFLKTNIQKLIQRRESILQQMAVSGFCCQEQIIRNLPALTDSFFPRDVRGIAAGQPGIIVAAGPSLDRNIDCLSCSQGYAWTFAVDTSLRILRQRGIDAQFVVTKDPTERNRAHFEGLENLDRPVPIFDPQIVPDIPPRFTGPKICMPNRNHTLHRYIDGLQLTEEDSLPHSTNVAIAAFNMAVAMGCDPIIFAGLDFCFSRGDGASHAAFSALCSETHYTPEQGSLSYRRGSVGEDIQVIEVEGIDGRYYPTTPNFYESLRLLESLIRQFPVRCIDASEGGARIAGTEIMRLEAAIQQFCLHPIGKPVIFNQPRPKRNLLKIRASLETISAHIERSGQVAQRALEDLRKSNETVVPESVLKARQEIESGYRLYHELQSALERLLVEISHPTFWDISATPDNHWRSRFITYFQTIEETCAYFAPVYREIAQSIGK